MSRGVDDAENLRPKFLPNRIETVMQAATGLREMGFNAIQFVETLQKLVEARGVLHRRSSQRNRSSVGPGVVSNIELWRAVCNVVMSHIGDKVLKASTARFYLGAAWVFSIPVSSRIILASDSR